MALRTLLVGLGGTGCLIVDKVAGMIKESHTPDHNIQCIGLDTDSNDTKNGIKKIENIEIVPTSREMSVKKYLERTQNWETWFPDNPLVKQRNMINGAGQIRPLSRLAFIETMSSNRLRKLKDAIKKLNLARGEVKPSNMRVMIVSSFAGGTGSGMFLHFSLFLRKYFREEYGAEILIRGLFAFPDMYMPTTSNLIEKESKYANAYGAIRELNAINEVCLSNDTSADRINIAFDGLFDSERDRGDAAQTPYNLMFFIDDIGNANRKLESLKQYSELMAKITYLQVYSPLSDIQDTLEDNRFGTLIQSGGKALYGSAGACSLEYPYEDIVKYCGIRAAADSVSENWRFFDNEYQKDKNKNVELRAADPSVPAIKRDEHYTNLVNSVIKDGKKTYKFIKIEIEDDFDGNSIKRHETYFAKISAMINKESADNTKLEQAAANCSVNKQNIADPTEMKAEINKVEKALTDYQEKIDEMVNLNKSRLIQSIFVDNYENKAAFSNGDFNIENLLTNQGKLIHPLSSRYLLYSIKERINAELNVSESILSACMAENTYYKEAYNIKSTKSTESADERADFVCGIPFPKLMPQFHAFKNQYKRLSDKQKKNLDDYRTHALRKAVFSEVLKRLNTLIKKYEVFFDSIPLIRENLIDEVENLENIHDIDSGLVTYVNATKEAKRDIYNNLTINISNDELGEVSKEIFKAMYDETCKEIEYKNRDGDDRNQENISKMEDVFRATVVNNTIEQIRENNIDRLDCNVYDAIRIHCARVNKNPKDILASVAKKGDPYLMYDDLRQIDSGMINDDKRKFESQDNYSYSLSFWGIHPQTREKTENENDYFNVGSTEVYPDVEVNERFSRYKIEYYKSCYGIKLKNISKFNETGSSFGSFYRNYQMRLNNMLEYDENATTPHLDIRWHLRSYLPFINSEKDKEEDNRIATALWLSLAYKGILTRTENKKKIFYSMLKDSTGEAIIWDEKKLSLKDSYELFLFMKNDEEATRNAMKYMKNFEEEQRIERNIIANKKFVIGLTGRDNSGINAINIMCEVLNKTAATTKDFEVLKESLDMLINDFCSKATKNKEKNEDIAARIKKMIFEGSKVKNKSKETKEYQCFSDWK